MLAAMASPAFAVRTILYYENECCRNITEGEFAILYCQGLKLREPAQGWTVQTAAAALTSLGHQPAGGWVLSRFLSEAVMARLLRNSPYYRKPFTDQDFQSSDRLVTIANARSVVESDEPLNQGEFAILLAQALKLPVPPDCSPEVAIRALMALPTPIKPVAGWKPRVALRETDMVEALALTQYRPTMIHPTMEIAPLQAYSLLFGKYEIATQGHFGLFIVEALGVPPPPSGWTGKSALAFVKSEFKIGNTFGLNHHAPLCTEFFLNSLRQILTQIQQTTPTTAGAPAAPGRLEAAAAPPGPQPRSGPSQPAAGAPDAATAAVESFIREARRSGMIPADVCETVPARALIRTTVFGDRSPTNERNPASSSK